MDVSMAACWSVIGIVHTYHQVSCFDNGIVPVNIREEDVIGFEVCVS